MTSTETQVISYNNATRLPQSLTQSKTWSPDPIGLRTPVHEKYLYQNANRTRAYADHTGQRLIRDRENMQAHQYRLPNKRAQGPGMRPSRRTIIDRLESNDWSAIKTFSWLTTIKSLFFVLSLGIILVNTLLPRNSFAEEAPTLVLVDKISMTPVDDYVRYLADKNGGYGIEYILANQTAFITLEQKKVSLRTHTHWYKLRVKNPNATPQTWFFTTGISTPPLLQAYWLSDNYPTAKDGKLFDQFIPAETRYHYPLRVIPVELAPEEVGTLIIEYQSLANFPLEIRPYLETDLVERSLRLLFANGAYLGAVSIFFLFFAAQFFIRPNLVHCYYTLFVLSIILIMVQVGGYGSQISGANSWKYNSTVTAIIGGSIYVWYFLFTTQFFQLKRFNPKLNRVLKGLTLAVIGLTVIGLFLPVDYLLSIVIVTGLPWPIITAVWALRRKHPSAKFFLVGSTTHCATTYLLMIACLGFETKSNEYFFGLASVGLLFDIGCFAVAILYQNNQLRVQYNQQLQERINDLNSLTESEQISAKALSMSKQAVLNTAATAHDLQQPLASMQLMLSMQDKNDPAINQINQALDYARALLNSALQNSKSDYQSIQETVSVRLLFESVVARHVAYFQAKGLTLEHRCQDTDLVCLPIVINRMLDNLLSNALKYTQTGRVLLTGRKRQDTYLIQVWDTGQGMHPSQVKKIMTPFERLSEENNDNLGFGLGLFIVKSLCDQAGYELKVKSKEGRGSCFSVIISAQAHGAPPAH